MVGARSVIFNDPRITDTPSKEFIRVAKNYNIKARLRGYYMFYKENKHVYTN